MSYNCYYIWPENKKYASTLSTCCFAIRKKIFAELKGFNTNIRRASCEDEEFGYFLIDRGYKIIILRELNVEHRVNYSINHFVKKKFRTYIEVMKEYLRNKTYGKKIKQTNYAKVLMGIVVVGLIMFTAIMIFIFPNKIIFSTFLISNIVFLLLSSVTPMINLSNIKQERLITSRWPFVTGSMLSFSIMSRMLSSSKGSKYSRSLVSKSVDTVSGFELTKILFMPATCSAHAACTEQ